MQSQATTCTTTDTSEMELIVREHSNSQVVCSTPNAGEEMMLAKTKMAPTKQRPTSASFATQQQSVRRTASSFVHKSKPLDKSIYKDRMPVRLMFKHPKLEAYAERNLKSRVVMALKSLTVKEFISEVLGAMKAESVRKSRVEVRFVSKSVKFPISFSSHDLLEKVFKKISSIEESRDFSRHSSNEDLLKYQGAQQPPAQNTSEANDCSNSEQGNLGAANQGATNPS